MWVNYFTSKIAHLVRVCHCDFPWARMPGSSARTSPPSSDLWLALLLPRLLLVLLRVLLRSMIICWALGTTDEVFGRSREEDKVQLARYGHGLHTRMFLCQASVSRHL